jgi:thiamine pyrophosphate-dependent acetolactate synthase large subunit-like protein
MIPLRDALEVLAENRRQQIVITTMSPITDWHQLSDTALDFAYIPSAMGQAPALGLGLALAQPNRGVIVVNGDGCMLMNLGCLVTIAQQPANLFLIIIDNGQYEVTGGQPTAGAGHTDFAGLARSSGIQRVYSFEKLDEWRTGAAETLSGPGPVVIWLKVQPKWGQKTPSPPRPMAEQISRLKEALSRTF